MNEFKKYRKITIILFVTCSLVLILRTLGKRSYVNLEIIPVSSDTTELTKAALKVNDSFKDMHADTVDNVSDSFDEDQSDWEIIYDEVNLRTEVENIHNSKYTVKSWDKCRQSVPDFVIVGVAKCGTRELSDFMSLHPNIVSKSNPYQIHGVRHIVGNISNEKVKEQMPCKYSDQMTSFKADGFLNDINKPMQLFNLNPNMKIIAIIREPIARVKSHLSYPHFNKTTAVIETSAQFNKYIAQEDRFKRYGARIRLSEYDVGLERYLKIFRRDQILVIESTEFMKTPVEVLKKVEKLLEIEHFDWDEHFVFNTEKKFFCIKKMNTAKKTMLCYGSDRGRKSPVELFDAERMESLRQHFKPHNENLYRLIGRRFDW